MFFTFEGHARKHLNRIISTFYEKITWADTYIKSELSMQYIYNNIKFGYKFY